MVLYMHASAVSSFRSYYNRNDNGFSKPFISMNNNPYEDEGSYDETSLASSESSEEESYRISRSFSSAHKYDESMSEKFDQSSDNNSAPSASLNDTLEDQIAFDNVDKDFCDEKGWSTGRESSPSSFSNAKEIDFSEKVETKSNLEMQLTT
jgi:hypothetical protein